MHLRVTSSTRLEDRRDAVRAIKALSKKFRLEVGTQCLDTLISVVRDDRMDGEIVSYAVEALWNITEIKQGTEGSEEAKLASQFSETITKSPENISMLLNLLEDFDFHVRRPTTCLLTTLLGNKLSEVQEAVLVSPMGISRMMDLLTDSREVIRNDALLLLQQLTRSNRQIQKIVAFENAFDRLFAIIRVEGHSDGGIVVEDCLYIMLNLLKGNNSNQAFFREASMIQQLVPFFEFKVPTASWSPQKVGNIYHMLKLIRTLVSPMNPQQATVSCQKSMNQCGLLGLLCTFMFASGVPTEILIETIGTVAEVIRGCEANQQYFESVTTPSEPPRSAILALLMSMVTEKQPQMLRLSALYCFQCYVYKNETGQAQIINTLLPSSSEPSVSAGQVLCAGLFGQDPVSNWCAAIALANSLNASLKPQLLRVQLSMQGKGQVTFLQQVMTILANQADLRVQSRIGFLILLCTWLADCNIAVVQFLNDSSNVPYLSGLIEQHYSTEPEQVLRSLSATILGVCLAYHDGSPTEYTPETLRQVIVHRIGQDAFTECLSHTSSSEYFTRAAKYPQILAENLDDLCFDHSFTVLFKQISDVILRSVDQSSPPAQAAAVTNTSQNGIEAASSHNASTSIEDHDSIVGSYKELIRDQDEELTALREKYASLEHARSQDASLLRQQLQEMQTLKEQLSLYGQLKENSGAEDEGGEVEQLQSTIISLQRIQDSQRQELASQSVQIQRLQGELETARGTKDQHLARTADELAKLREDVAQLRAENEALKTDRDALDEQLKSLQDQQPPEGNQEVGVTESLEVTQLQQQLKQLNRAYIKLQETNQTIEKEQEDLLVFLADHDAKNKKYHKLLVDNNIDIPDEEEEEEESDLESEEEEEGVEED